MTNGSRLAAILLVAIGVLAHYSSAQAQHGTVLQRAPILIVVDSDGKILGNVIGFTSNSLSGAFDSPTVAFRLQNTLLILGIAFDRIHAGPGGTNDSIRFESPDCTGTPYTTQTTVGGAHILPPYVLDSGTQVVYLPNGSIRPIAIKSVRESLTGVCQQEEFESDAIPLYFLVDLKPLFAPPFSIRRATDNQ